mgnify:CR=1 FL=1
MASEKILAMIEEVKGLSVLELNELVKALEEEFGSDIPDEDAEKLTTVGDAIKYIEGKQKA